MECNVLVVDSDPICLAIVSKMLCLFGYTVSTARKAADALSLARERKSGFQLILTEIHLPDMGRYDFIEKMERFSKSPFVILTSDNDEKAMLGGLVKGAKMYLIKPLQMNNLKYLWQIAYRKFDQGPVESIEYEEPRISYGESLQRNAIVEDLESRVSIKREYGAAGEAEMHANEEEDSEGSTSLIKRPKLIWNDELHNMFLQAINIIGVDGARANAIHQLMNVPGLTKENVSSHLQKYRLTLKREQDAIQEKAMMARPSSGSGDLAPYNNIPPSPPLNLQEGIGTNARRDLPGFGENIQFVKEENFVNEKMDFCNVGNLGFGSVIESPNPMSNFIKQSQQEQQLQQPQVGLEEITGENDINFGAERDGIDELFKTENGSTQVVFRDEDLDDFV